MVNIYKSKKLTNYLLGHDEWIRLGEYGLHKESDKFILKSSKGKVLSKFNNLHDGVLTLIETRKGGKDGQ